MLLQKNKRKRKIFKKKITGEERLVSISLMERIRKERKHQ